MDKNLLIQDKIEIIINNIKNININPFNNQQKELSENVLIDYYNLVANHIENITMMKYLLHLISVEINNSNSLQTKNLLLSLLPEFFIPFFTVDISLTYPYIPRILTTIQSNIQSSISPIYIGEIFKKIIQYLFNDENGYTNIDINTNIFETCQGFCFYNMKLKDFQNQVVGIICLNVLLTEINYNFLNQNNFVYYILEKVLNFLENPNFVPKYYLLKYLYDLIAKFKASFKPYVNCAIYKILEYIENDDLNLRKSSLNILGLIISFFPDEIEPVKNLLKTLLQILYYDSDEGIKNKSIYIYNKLRNHYHTNSLPINKILRNKKNNLLFCEGFNFSHKRTNTNSDIIGMNLLLKTKSFEINENAFGVGGMNIPRLELKKKNIAENQRYINTNSDKVNFCCKKENIGFKELLSRIKSDSNFNSEDFFKCRENIKKKNNNKFFYRKKNVG